ncbi:MAG: hypothetical protein C0464_02235 [Cyanobacteria bacterium DS2.008]|nr:hypothetical protein [Cyanobacteria bacterium DS2.008]
MNHTVRSYQTPDTALDPATTSGMDDLFEVELDSVHQADIEVQDAVQLETPDIVHEEITVVEASQLLNVDRRSVVRLLHWNKLSGRKSSSGKWLVDKASVLARLESSDSVQDGVLFEVVDTVQVEQEPEMDMSSPLDSEVQDTVLVILKQQSEQLKNAYTYLDAATARIIYLQQQLENKDQEIKLLTDSQHKPSWWKRLAKAIGIV